MMKILRGAAACFGLLLLMACEGEDRGVGEITAPARSPAAVAAQDEARSAADRTLRARGAAGLARQARQILFGDLHVHSTYSLDAFTVELPMMGLQGAHPPADSCDFARYCAQLDFFSLTDHAETLTPEHWSSSKKIIRACAARSGDRENPDLVPFLGWEWTQVGLRPENHWGHKNVIFPGIGEQQLPLRPISSRPHDSANRGVFENVRQVPKVRFVDPAGWKEYQDLAWLIARLDEVPRCPRGVPVRDLPPDCHESAATPKQLYERLDQWGLDALVIPHGNSWGIYTPPLASWDKALAGGQHDPRRQRLIEVMSGHGNSEEFRPWRAGIATATGLECPAPTKDYLPCCWQAGEIIRSRCGDLPVAQCESRVAAARRLALEAGASYAQVVSDAQISEWLDCGQCRDCFKPAFGMVPRESVQYAMALSNFQERDSRGQPLRFRFGFLASTDDHTSRPGTGYKQYERRKMTFATGPRAARFLFSLGEEMEDPQRAQAVHTEWVLPDSERAQSFTFPGGIVAVHAAGRSREEIWAALKRREVYGTSGPRILLWFDLLQGSGVRPMGSELTQRENPRFEVRAAGAFRQREGCPAASHQALDEARLEYLCAGQCYFPGTERHPIEAIEVVRILPQRTPGEPLEALIEDPWKRMTCPQDGDGCVVQFEDEEWLARGRDAVYYVRALQEPTEAINGATLRTSYDGEGNAIAVNPCYGDFRTDLEEDCLAPVRERAWSSPIFLNQAGP